MVLIGHMSESCISQDDFKANKKFSVGVFVKECAKKVHCKLCSAPGTVLAFHGGTTCMRNHLSSHHKKEYSVLMDASTSQLVLDLFMKNKSCSIQRANEITQLIAEMVA